MVFSFRIGSSFSHHRTATWDTVMLVKHIENPAHLAEQSRLIQSPFQQKQLRSVLRQLRNSDTPPKVRTYSPSAGGGAQLRIPARRANSSPRISCGRQTDRPVEVRLDVANHQLASW